MDASIVIVGSGLAAYTSLREIRKLNPDIKITLITQEDGDFYSKPMLSTAFANQKNAAQLITTPKEKMIDQLKFDLLTNPNVLSIDTLSHSLAIESSGKISRLSYSKLILATGADPIRLKLAGSGVDDILSVNLLSDYAVFREKLSPNSKVAILGAGLIGCEFANDLIVGGFKVEVIDLAPHPLGKLLPSEIADVLRKNLETIGVVWHLQKSTSEIIKLESNRYQVQFDNNTSIEVDIVLSAVGLKPKTQLAIDAGLNTQRGIQINRFMQTSNPDIFAIGDCVEIEGLVLPYVMPIMQSAKVLAANVLGDQKILQYPAMPVMVKTPALPLIISPPANGVQGEWHIEHIEDGIIAKFIDHHHVLQGFTLAGSATKERAKLVSQLPPILS